MNLRTLTLPLTLSLGLTAAAFATDLPVTATPALVAPTGTTQVAGTLVKNKTMKKIGKSRVRKHGKGRKVAKLTRQSAKK